MKILTCNVQGISMHDGQNAWPFRKELCFKVIREENPDIICFQELQQYDDMVSAFPDFATFETMDTPIDGFPMNSIFYRKERYSRISAGAFWLSEQPHIPGSKSWDSNCIRLVNWVRLREQFRNMDFLVVNTHLDHLGATARIKQAELIIEFCAAYPETYPKILTGDMNCGLGSEPISLFLQDGWRDTYSVIHGDNSRIRTFHRFQGESYIPPSGEEDSIDWIFTQGEISVKDAEVITHSEEERFPSDHYFVSAKVSLNP